MSAINPNLTSGPYIADGSQRAFPFNFSIAAEPEISVLLDGGEVSKLQYAVAFGDIDGTVTFSSPPALGAAIMLLSAPDFEQASSFESQGAYTLDTVNKINRRAAIRDLVLKSRVDAFTDDVAAIAAPIATAAAEAVVVDIEALLDGILLNGVYSSVAAALAGGTTGQFVRVMQSSLYQIDTYAKTDANSLVPVDAIARRVGAGIAAGAVVDSQMAVLNALPVRPWLAIFGIDAQFNERVMIPPRFLPQPARNYAALTPDQDMLNSATVVGVQADPWGGDTGFRVRLPASNSCANLYKFKAGEAGDYRVGFQAKSQAGAGNQTFRVYKNFTTLLATVNVTEGAWVVVDFTLTSIVTNDFFSVFDQAGGTIPLDILISPLVITPIEVKAPPHPAPATGAVVLKKLSLPGSISVDSHNNINGPLLGFLNLTDNGLDAKSFTAMTMWLTFKKTGTGGTYCAPIWAKPAGESWLSIGTYNDGYSFEAPGLSYAVQPSWNAYGDEFITLCLRFDAARTTASLGTVDLGLGSGTGGTPYTVNQLWFMAGPSAAFPFPGKVHSFGMVESYLEDADLAELVLAVDKFCKDDGNLLGARNILFVGGDSSEGGSVATGGNGYVQQAAANLGLPLILDAVGGSNFAGLDADPRRAYFKKRISQCVAGGKQALVYFKIGSNGPLATAPQLQGYIDEMLALGTTDNPVKVLIGTIMDIVGRTNADTTTYNNLIRGLLRATIVDIASDAPLGGVNASLSGTYFYSDHQHMIDAGHAIAQGFLEAALTPLRH